MDLSAPTFGFILGILNIAHLLVALAMLVLCLLRGAGRARLFGAVGFGLLALTGVLNLVGGPLAGAAGGVGSPYTPFLVLQFLNFLLSTAAMICLAVAVISHARRPEPGTTFRASE